MPTLTIITLTDEEYATAEQVVALDDRAMNTVVFAVLGGVILTGIMTTFFMNWIVNLIQIGETTTLFRLLASLAAFCLIFTALCWFGIFRHFRRNYQKQARELLADPIFTTIVFKLNSLDSIQDEIERNARLVRVFTQKRSIGLNIRESLPKRT